MNSLSRPALKTPLLSLVRGVALVGLALAACLLVVLLVLSLPGMGPATEALFALDRRPQSPDFAEGLTVALVIATLAGAMLFGWRRRVRSPVAARLPAPGAATPLAGRRRIHTWRWIGGTVALIVFVPSLLILTQPAMAATAASILGAKILVPHWPSFGAGAVAVLLALTLPILLYAAWRLRRCPWWGIGCGYLVVALVFACLASDDTSLRRPLTIEEIAPAFPGDEASFAVLMRYGQMQPLNQNLKVPVQLGQYPNFAQTAATREWLTANRDKIAANWAAFAPVRAWWAELNAFERIGDLTPLRADAEIIGFHTVREVSLQSSEVAGLQALDGQGDAAMATLLPVVEVAGKLEASARTVVRLAAARTVRNHALAAAGFVLDTAPVSTAARARFAAALTDGNGGEAGARRMFDLDYVWALSSLLNRPLGDLVTFYDPERPWFVQPLNLVGSLVYNPRHTANLHGEVMAEAREMAAHRQLEQMRAYEEAFPRRQGRPGFKNFAGTLLLLEAHPENSSIVRNYWKEEDQRTALLARLMQT